MLILLLSANCVMYINYSTYMYIHVHTCTHMYIYMYMYDEKILNFHFVANP